MHPHTVQELPSDYHEVLFFRVTERSLMLILNLAALALLAVSAAFFLGWLLFYHLIGAPLVIEALPDSIPLVLGILIVIAVLPLHEWVHGLAISYFGHKPRYGVKLMKGVLYATADQALFWRNQYMAVALAPLVVISLFLGALSLFFPPEIGLWLMFAAVVNASGAIGDVWMAWVTLRYPVTALVRDEEDGMRIYTSGKAKNSGD